MEGIIKVTPEKLISASSEFENTGGTMKGITGEMMNLVNSLKGIWQGEASNIYNTRFNSLQEDMDRMYRMIKEHASDLNEMANSYSTAEKESSDTGNRLKAGVIV